MKCSILSIISIFLLNLALSAQTEGELTVNVTTSQAGGKYAPRNIVAIWVEDNSGKFVKTLLVNAEKRITHLNTWQKSTGDAGNEFHQVDAISGATNSQHGTRTCTWDGTDINGDIVNDGTYTLHLELTDKDATGNHSALTFSKGTNAESQNPIAQASFSKISLQWTPKTTGIKINEEVSKPLAVYPNPSQGVFTIIQSNITVIEVRNMKGQLVYEGQDKTVDISQQPNGIYFVSLTANKAYSTTKLVKQ